MTGMPYKVLNGLPAPQGAVLRAQRAEFPITQLSLVIFHLVAHLRENPF